MNTTGSEGGSQRLELQRPISILVRANCADTNTYIDQYIHVPFVPRTCKLVYGTLFDTTHTEDGIIIVRCLELGLEFPLLIDSYQQFNDVLTINNPVSGNYRFEFLTPIGTHIELGDMDIAFKLVFST